MRDKKEGRKKQARSNKECIVFIHMNICIHHDREDY